MFSVVQNRKFNQTAKELIFLLNGDDGDDYKIMLQRNVDKVKTNIQ